MDLRHLFGYGGKTVVISGAFSGMGLAAARLLSQLGADVYAICRRNGRHNTLDFPVKKILYADFGSKEDLDLLAEALPDNIYAMFLCHGIALKNDGSNTLEVQRVNFLGHKYLLEKSLHKVCDRGSVNIISSTGGYDWQSHVSECMEVINAETYEDGMTSQIGRILY